MKTKVESINLDEIKKAREELGLVSGVVEKSNNIKNSSQEENLQDVKNNDFDAQNSQNNEINNEVSADEENINNIEENKEIREIQEQIEQNISANDELISMIDGLIDELDSENHDTENEENSENDDSILATHEDKNNFNNEYNNQNNFETADTDNYEKITKNEVNYADMSNYDTFKDFEIERDLLDNKFNVTKIDKKDETNDSVMQNDEEFNFDDLLQDDENSDLGAENLSVSLDNNEESNLQVNSEEISNDSASDNKNIKNSPMGSWHSTEKVAEAEYGNDFAIKNENIDFQNNKFSLENQTFEENYENEFQNNEVKNNFKIDKKDDILKNDAMENNIQTNQKNIVAQNDYVNTLPISNIREEIKNNNYEHSENYLPNIADIAYVNILSMQDFKNSDNLTFALGKNEYGNVVYENLRDMYNIAVFANDNAYSLVKSILISLMLKNNFSDIKFAILEGSLGYRFEEFENSKYLFGSTICKNDDEIDKKLRTILDEIESRYKLMARFNVKNIDEYNVIAKNSNVKRLSNILVVVDGYFDLMHSLSFQTIKESLYQILKFGRIAGVYAIVISNQKIEEDIINFNLPSRIAFKVEHTDESISLIGESGLERLNSDNEFLYANVTKDRIEHISAPKLSDAIIDLLIKNIEK